MDGVARCERYVKNVLSGKVLAPETIKQACRRYEADKNREDIYLDKNAANAAVANTELMRHVKAKWRGKPIVLEDWQCFSKVNIFGWKWTDTEKRRFRKAYKRVPRKNGKTLDALTDAFIMLALDNEPGAEVFLGATSQDQANEVLLEPAKEIVRQTPEFKDLGIEINARSIVLPDSFSVLKSVIRKPKDGPNPHCAIVDEYHQHDTNEQVAAFETGMGGRDQPLLEIITTAGSNLGGPCKEFDDFCKKVLDGTLESDTTFVLIYEPDEDDEWHDPETLKKVNPNYGVAVNERYLLDQLSQAKASATKQNEYRTKHLNQWVGARTAWMNMLAWQRQKSDLTMDDFKGMKCRVALDLASKIDLAALAIVFRNEDEYHGFVVCFAPEDAVAENPKLRELETKGCLISTPGSATDYAFIEQQVRELMFEFNDKGDVIGPRFDVATMGYDPWQASYLAQRLELEGLEIVEYRQTVATMSEPMKELESMVLSGKFHHDGNSALTWCMGNVQARRDEKDNVYPTKEDKNSGNKIDAAVALIMAFGLWLEEEPEPDYTSTHGIISL